MTRADAAALAAGAVAAIVAATVVVKLVGQSNEPAARCGLGFTAVGPRCCTSADAVVRDGVCFSHDVLKTCPAPLVLTPRGCDAPDTHVRIPKTEVLIGPSDWEAEGRVPPRLVTAGPFALDAFEMTVGRFAVVVAVADGAADAARAANSVTVAEASRACAERGGRLPTENEWIVAAAGATARRYPWGDTGAVCRRAAWGLARGPCASGAVGPDSVGAHEGGVSPLGLHDLAGNVAEWVSVARPPVADAGLSPGVREAYVARGGSWQSALATELRTWSRLEVAAGARDPRVGFRCAYDE